MTFFAYLRSFVDRDMFMHFRGGIGHKSIRKATMSCLHDRFPEELECTTVEEDESEPAEIEETNVLGEVDYDNDQEMLDEEEIDEEAEAAGEDETEGLDPGTEEGKDGDEDGRYAEF